METEGRHEDKKGNQRTPTWDLATSTACLGDGSGPDPYPSPDGTFQFTTKDSETHVYVMAGVVNLNLTVRDDDGGSVEIIVAPAIL
jgi:hypothetical protein